MRSSCVRCARAGAGVVSGKGTVACSPGQGMVSMLSYIDAPSQGEYGMPGPDTRRADAVNVAERMINAPATYFSKALRRRAHARVCTRTWHTHHLIEQFPPPPFLQRFFFSSSPACLHTMSKDSDSEPETISTRGAGGYRPIKRQDEPTADEATADEAALTTKLPGRGVFHGPALVRGQRHGRGTFVSLTGDRYMGTWCADEKHGFFEIDYANGERFAGAFVRDRREGRGVHSWPDGSRFEGEWSGDLRHGAGVFHTRHEYYECQKMFVRRYERGVLVDEREAYTQHQLLSDRPGFGFGVHVDDDGVRYEGEYENYQRHGNGILTLPDGTVWIGPFFEGKRHGTGMRRTTLNEYFFERFAHGEQLSCVASDYMNWRNLFWYDEGGQRQ